MLAVSEISALNLLNAIFPVNAKFRIAYFACTVSHLETHQKAVQCSLEWQESHLTELVLPDSVYICYEFLKFNLDSLPCCRGCWCCSCSCCRAHWWRLKIRKITGEKSCDGQRSGTWLLWVSLNHSCDSVGHHSWLIADSWGKFSDLVCIDANIYIDSMWPLQHIYEL